MGSGSSAAAPPSSRTIDHWKLADFLLVGTIDGSLHARDRQTGMELWSIPGASPLVTVSSAEVLQQDRNLQDESEITWIVEPLGDGILYYFMPSTGLHRLPVSIKQLVLESPFAIHGDDKIYTGSRQTTLYSINASTGAIIKVYGDKVGLGKAECKVRTSFASESMDLDYDDDDEYFGMNDGEENGTFMIGRTGELDADIMGRCFILTKVDYHLEIHGKNETIWNVTYSTWGPNNMDGDLATQYVSSPDSLYVTPVHNSSILALSTDKRTKKPARWVGSVPAMVVTVFDVLKSTSKPQTEPLMLLPQPQYPSSSQSQFVGPNLDPSGTYIERTKEGQWFALSGTYFPSLVGSAPVAKWCNGHRDYKTKEEMWLSVVGVHPMSLADWQSTTSEGNVPGGYVPGISGPAPPLGIEGPPTSMIGFHPQPDSVLDHRSNQNQVDKYRGNHYFGRQRPDQASKPSPLPLAGPPPHQQEKDFQISPWWNLISRLVENLMTLAIVVAATVAAARFGWLPQLTELLVLLNSRQRSTEKAHESEETKAEPPTSQVAKVQSNVTTTTTTTTTNEENDTNEILTDKEKITTDEKNITIVEPDTQQQQQAKSPEKRKRKRGSRGGKKNKSASAKAEQQQNEETVETNGTASVANNNAPQDSVAGLAMANIEFNDKDVVGLGSHGTVVFKGTFAGRPAAIKRMVMSFCDIASQEVDALQESDDHPNVIRYYSKFQNTEFLYIALELCPCSLEQVIETPYRFQEMTDRMDPKDVLRQTASGLKHLHLLGIVHRDIKPQNILIAPQKKIHSKNSGDDTYAPIRIVISDFGLCKKLEYDQSSFRPTTAHLAGTAGWIAPEISRHDMKRQDLTESGEDSSHDLLMGMDRNRRLTRAVDIFSLGCVFYYILSHGGHPFGENQRREINIEEYNYSLPALDDDSEQDNVEARDLITQMISHNPSKRPKISQVLLHPYFWSSQRKLDYLIKVSDWIESEGRVEFPELLDELENDAPRVIGDAPWFEQIDKGLIDNLQQYRKYQHRISDLLRALRNKCHHYNELPPQLQEQLPLPEGFLRYFTKKYPLLLITIYYFGKRHLTEKMPLKCFFQQQE